MILRMTQITILKPSLNDFNTLIKFSPVLYQKGLKKVMIQTLDEPDETFSALSITGKTPRLKT